MTAIVLVQETLMRSERTCLSKLSFGETLLISRCFSSSSFSSSVYLEERSWAGAAALSTAAFYSPRLKADRFPTVRDQGLVQRESCGNSHSDDGWGPHWDRCLAPSRLISAALLQRCRAPRTLPRWRRDRGARVSGASQPIAVAQRSNTCVEPRLDREGDVPYRWTQVEAQNGMSLDYIWYIFLHYFEKIIVFYGYSLKWTMYLELFYLDFSDLPFLCINVK